MSGRTRVLTSQLLTLKPAERKSPARLQWTLGGGLLPAVNRVVAESHLVRLVSLEPFDMGVGEKDVLPIVVCFPSHGRSSIGIAADTILRVVILVSVIGQKILPA